MSKKTNVFVGLIVCLITTLCSTAGFAQVSSFSELVKGGAQKQGGERLLPVEEAFELIVRMQREQGCGSIYYNGKIIKITKNHAYYDGKEYQGDEFIASFPVIDMDKIRIAPPVDDDYCLRASIASAVGTCESIRGAMAAYAADSAGNLFPHSGAGWRDITNWNDLVNVLNSNGASLKKTEAEQGMKFITYKNWDLDGDNQKGDDYYFIFTTPGVPSTLTGALIEVRSSGIQRWSGAM